MATLKSCFISALVAIALCAGCGKGRSVILITVTSRTPISGIELFSVVVATGERQAGPYAITPAAPLPATLPPERRFSLSFDASISGDVAVGVQAIGADGTSLAGGNQNVAIQPSETRALSIELQPGKVPPGGYALRDARMGTIGPHDDNMKGYRLFDDGFEFGDRACAGATCVTGALTP
jgi:hypothetical protein